MITTLLFDIHEVVLLRNHDRYEEIARNFGVTTIALTTAIHGVSLGSAVPAPTLPAATNPAPAQASAATRDPALPATTPTAVTPAITLGLWDRYKTGDLTEEAYWHTVVGQLGAGFRGTWAELRDWMDVVDEVNVPLVEWIRGAKNRFRMAALSNAGADLERRLSHFGLDDLFNPVINSHRVLVAKPDEGIYRLALEKLGARADEVLFVDDRERNTLVADGLGFHTHVYRDFDGFRERVEAIGSS